MFGYFSFGHGDFPYSNSKKGKVLAEIANIHRLFLDMLL